MTSKLPLKIDFIASARKLAASGHSSVSLFQHGDANVLLFVPTDQDTQVKHERDEIYVIQSGQGIFKRGEETSAFCRRRPAVRPCRSRASFLELFRRIQGLGRVLRTAGRAAVR